MAFVSLAIIALVAFASPFIASAIPGKPVPETVFLLVFGAVLGPHMLGVIHVDAEVSLVSELGLAFLFLLAGFEIDPKNITGVEGRYGMATWAVTFGIAWLAVRFTPWFSVSHFDGIAVTLALTSTALGALMPILRERSLTGTRVGDSILAYGTWGELGPVLAMSVLLSARTGIETLVILGLFAVVCVLLAVVPSRSKRIGSRFFAFIQERADTTSQTFVRLTVLILVTLVAFSAIFSLDIVLGAFAAGFVLRYIIPEGNHTLETKLDGLAYGFLIPVFFTVSGAKIDLTARTRTGCSSLRTRPITTRPKSSPSAVPPPAWAAPSATRSRAAAMCTRPCASPVPATPPSRFPRRSRASCRSASS